MAISKRNTCTSLAFYWALFFLFLHLAPQASANQYNQNLELLSGTKVGKPYKIQLVGGYAYVAAIQSLLVYDITEPTRPDLIGHYPFYPGEEGLDLAIEGNYAYVAQKQHGFWVLNIANPDQPRLVKEFLYEKYPDQELRSGWVFGLSFADNHIYLADDNGGLRIINVNNPAAPQHVGVHMGIDKFWIRDVVCVNNIAYLVSQWSGLICVDVSNQQQPTKIGEALFQIDDITGKFEGVAVQGHYAYLVSTAQKKDTLNNWIGNPGLRIIDIADPSAPTLTASVVTPEGALDVAVNESGTYAYLASTVAGLIIIDISDATSPMLVGSYATPGAAHGVAVRGQYAYVADHYRGLRVLDIANPANPSEVGFYETPINSQQLKLSSTGYYAFVIDAANDQIVANPQYTIHSSVLRIMDISNSRQPRLLSTYATTGTAKDLALYGHYAMVAAGEAGIDVIDIADPLNPDAVVPPLELGASVDLLDINDTFLLTLTTNGPLKVYRHPLNPTLLGDGDTKVVSAFAMVGNYIYAAERGPGKQPGIHIFKVDPVAATLQAIGNYETDDSIQQIKGSDEHLYLLSRQSNRSLIRVLDLADPRFPRHLTSYPVTDVSTLQPAGNHLIYAASTSGEVRIIDYSNYYQPGEKAYLNLGGSFTGIDYRHDTIYATNNVFGFLVLNYQPKIPPSYDKFHTFARPNPFIPSRSTTTFTLPANQATNQYSIRIINLKGHLIRTLVNEYEWNGRDQQGRPCESGVYLYQIILSQQKNQPLTGKVVLIR